MREGLDLFVARSKRAKHWRMKISGGVPKLVPPMLRPYRIFVGAKHERDHLWDSRKGLDSLMLRPFPLATCRRAGGVRPHINSPTASFQSPGTHKPV